MLSASGRSLLPLVLASTCLPASLCAVLELPIWFRNSYAIVEVEVGTPEQQHFLHFDTGSSTTWMVDKTCADSTCTNYSGYERNGYLANASSTSLSLGTYDSIDYIGGETAGYAYADIFSIPSAASLSWNQTFLSADKSSWYWMPCDGFLGLAFSTIASPNTSTMVETLMQDGSLDEPRFAIYFGKEFNDTGNAAGEGALTIGGSYEEKYVEGDLTWVEPLQFLSGQYQLWRTDMVSLTSTMCTSESNDSAKTPTPAASSTTHSFSNSWVVFDTGAGDIAVPPSQIQSIYASIGMNYTAILSGAHIPLCTEFNASWSVTFGFGDSAAPSTVTLTGEQLARPGFGPGSDAYCWPPFDDSGVEGFFLFGTPFLHQLYSVYDFGAFEVAGYQPRIGFGQLKEEYSPRSSS